MKKSILFLFLVSCWCFLPAQDFVNKNDTSLVFDLIDTLPVFPGGEKELMKYLSSNVIYPLEALKNKIKGKVIVSFVIDKTGKVINCEIVRGINKDLDTEALRVVSSIPNWTPGIHKGNKVKCKYFVPIDFQLKANEDIETTINQLDTISVDEKIYDVSEIAPSFPGGDNALMKYLSQSIKYPIKAQEYGVMGKIIIQFVVDRNGEIIDVQALRSMFTVLETNKTKKTTRNDNRMINNTANNIDDATQVEYAKKDLESEAMRVIRTMPNWNPGKQKGKNVKCKFFVPINFKLQ